MSDNTPLALTASEYEIAQHIRFIWDDENFVRASGIDNTSIGSFAWMHVILCRFAMEHGLPEKEFIDRFWVRNLTKMIEDVKHYSELVDEEWDDEQA